MNRSALIVIDMQNGFLHPDGSIPRAGMVVPGAADLVSRTAALVAAARARDVPVVHTRHSYRHGGLEMPAWYRRAAEPVLAVAPDMLARGSWDADVVDELAPAQDGIVIDKIRFDAFLHTDLEVVLRALRVERLVVAGVVTNLCVESTVRSALQRDFEVSVAADCTAALPGQHEPALDSMRAAFAEVGDGTALLDRAGTGPTAVR